MGTPAGMSPPSAPVKERQVHQCLRLLLVKPCSFKKGTHLRLRWPPAAAPRQPVAQPQLG
jgi:hypothetical protein